MIQRLSYTATPTLAAFHASNAFVRGVMGPLGSGKSSAMCMEILMRGARQKPSPDAVRRSRFAVVRNTQAELRTTTIKTWQDWLSCPAHYPGATPPYTSRVRQNLGDGTRMDLEVLFLSLNRPDDAKKLLSLELTGAWVNEAREIPVDIIHALTSRVGRYPAKRHGGPSYSGLFMDTNPPGADHWWFKHAEQSTPQGWRFFRQPPALLETPDGYRPNPGAENLDNQPLGADYWLRQVHGKSRQWINVYLLGQYGDLTPGNRVFPEYEDSLHCATAPLTPSPHAPFVLGWDFGLTPACVITQPLPGGRLIVLHELAENSMGIRRFARSTVLPYLKTHFPDHTMTSIGDPAGTARAQTDERTCMEELAKAGLPTRPARTNAFAARREAVAAFLSRKTDNTPAFLLNTTCPTLRQGFLGGYHFASNTDRPEKNRFSHLHDALQYAALHAQDRHERPPARPTASRRPLPADGFAGY
jgi:hypothetical protein